MKDTLIKQVFSNFSTDDTQNIFTPPSLCREMLSHIKFKGNEKVLVLYNLEFALILNQEFGLPTSSIYIYTNSKTKQAFSKYGFNILYFEDALGLNKVDMKFDIVVGNPPYQETRGASKGTAIWHHFVETSLSLLKTGGYLTLIHPPGWRAPKGQFKVIGDILKNLEIIHLTLCDYNKGNQIFNVGTAFDFYTLKNIPNNNTKCALKDVEGNINYVDISKLPFIPNVQINKFLNLLPSSPNESRVNFLGNSSYHSQREYISKISTPNHVYPVVWTIGKKKGITTYYSSVNNKGHFGERKVIFSHGNGSYPIIDSDGKYGLTEFAFGIIDHIDNLPKIKKALESDEFISLMKNVGFRNMKYEPKVIELFKKDFWKEFV
jgi:hypothetical protein